MGTLTKVAIGLAAFGFLSVGGFFFINNTEKGEEIKDTISQVSVSSEEHSLSRLFGSGNTPSSKVESIIRVTTESIVTSSDDPAHFLDTDKKLNETGGYITGGGTLKDGEYFILTAHAFDGYQMVSWYIQEGDSSAELYDEMIFPQESQVVVGCNSSTCDIQVSKNTRIGAIFLKKESPIYRCLVDISPRVGRIYSISYDNPDNHYDYPNDAPPYDIFGPNHIDRVNFKWNITYEELEHNFTYIQESYSYGTNNSSGSNTSDSQADTTDDGKHTHTHTTGSNSSTGSNTNNNVTLYKIYDIEYDYYIFDEKGNKVWSQKNQDCKIRVDLCYIDETGRPVVIEDAMSKEYTVGDISHEIPPEAGKRCSIVVVPHTKEGGEYQIITKADPITAGTTSGDKASTSRFSSSISATPAKGYKFDRWTWEENTGTRIDNDAFREVESKEKTITVSPNGVVEYIAHFVPEYYTIELESVTPEEGGSVHGLGDYPAHKDAAIYIRPDDGYEVESWNYTTEDGSRYSGDSSEFKIQDITSNIKLSVKFTNGKARIEVKSYPVDIGSATVMNTTTGKREKTDYEEFVPGKEAARLTAKPVDPTNYKFLYWKDSQDRTYEGKMLGETGFNELYLDPVASSEKFTAYFAPKNVSVDVAVYPTTDGSGSSVNAGSVTVKGDHVTVASTDSYLIESNTSVTIEATEATGYHFQKFVDSNGKEYNTNPLVKTDIVSSTKFTAIFVEDEFDISAIASPSTGGQVTVNGRAGSNSVHYNQNVDLIATPNTAQNYMFRYFEDQNGNKYSGEPGTDSEGNKIWKLSFSAVNGAETYKAVFGLDSINLNIKVDPNTGEGTKYKAGGFKVEYTKHGESTTTTSDTYYDKTPITAVQGGKTVKITAVPGDGYHFSKFVDTDGNIYTENPLIYPDLVENKDVEIVYVPDSFTISAQATPVIGGTVTVNGRKGSNEVAYGESVTLTATPDTTGDRKFIFKYFEDQNGTKFKGKETPEGSGNYSFTFDAVNGAETYKAVFGMEKVSLNVKVDEVIPAGGTYKTGGFRVDYTDISDNPVSSSPYYSEQKFEDVAGGKSVKITAVDGDGYHFAKFVDTDGNVFTENPLIYPDLTENKDVEIIFVPDSFTIYANATPVTGGTTLIEAWDKGSTGGDPKTSREGSCEVGYGDKVKITANATGAYVFRYFEDPNGTKYGGEVAADKKSATFTFNAVNGTETYKAVFGMDEAAVSVKVDPNTTKTVDGNEKYVAGHAEVTYTKGSDGASDTKVMDYGAATITDIKGGTSVKINAIAGDGYHFSKFVDTDGNVYTENPLIYPDLYEMKDVEIIFVPDTFTIKANATPVTGGHVDVVVLDKDKNELSRREGSNEVSYNQLVRVVAKPSGNFAFRYFEDPNGSKYAPTGYEDGYPYFEFNAVNGSETYKAVFAMSDVNLSVTVDPKKKENGIYVAGGFKIDYTATDDSEVKILPTYKDWSTKDEGQKKIKGQTSVKITAIDGDGYHFAKFVDTDGNVYTENPLIYPDLVESKSVEVIFVPDSFTINAQATPVIGGKADVAIINKSTGEITSKREGSNEVSYDELVRIIAKPNPGYAFKYFEDKNGSRYGGTKSADGSASFEFNAVNGSETYKAVFAMDTVHLSVKVDPNTTDPSSGTYVAGSFKVNYTYNDITTGKDVNTDKEGSRPNFTIDNIKGQTSVKITAIENSGYKFSKFIDSEGNTWNDNPMVLGDLVENKDIEVIFVKEHWRIDGIASPEAGGRVTLNGVDSGLDVDYGDHVSIMATPNEGYRFKYFKDDLGNEFLANPIEFNAINGSEKYTAYFAKDDVSITLDLAPEGSGTVRFNSEPAVSTRTTYSTNGAKSVTLTATPKEDIEFLYWRDQDGKSYSDNPLVLSDISSDLIFTAIFDSKVDTIRAIASPASGGKIRKIINDDGSITLVASANRGYDFIKWEKPEGTTSAYRFTIPANQVHTGDLYTAIFKIDPNYDAKSDITKEKFYREWRKVITPNYTVTRDSMKLLAMQTVSGLRQYDDATPGLRSYGAFASAKAYFDERVAKDVARLDGLFGDSELMSAEGDVLTPDLLPDEDKYDEDARAFTDKKFGDHYDTEVLTVKRILQPEGFDNTKRTYLWRYTGAEYKDNIYLLYNIGGSKHDWATPIVDEDGVLKFTIDKLDDRDVVAVVRVKVK